MGSKDVLRVRGVGEAAGSRSDSHFPAQVANTALGLLTQVNNKEENRIISH